MTEFHYPLREFITGGLNHFLKLTSNLHYVIDVEMFNVKNDH